jgi:galactose mutarotase-like enzyme
VVTITVLSVMLLVLAFGWREHVRGQFGRLKRELKGTPQVAVPVSQPPGGQEPLVLERSALEGDSIPEFLSAVFLPGRGMNLLQLKAYIPGKGEVDLLDSPPLATAEERLTGKDADAQGFESLAMGGAVEIPWAGKIYGSSFNNNSISTVWQGRALHLPGERQGAVSVARGGLLLRSASTTTKINVMPDGGEATAEFDTSNFDGHWPSKLHVTTTAQLSGHSLELKITAQNSGSEPLPVGIGWQPRFSFAGAKKDDLTLRIPSTTRLELNPRTGEPTGKLLAVSGTPYDLSARSGAPLGTLNLEDTFVNLRQAPLDNGPVVDLRNAAGGYGLRMTILSPTIKAMHVSTPVGGGSITIAPRFNYDDPFGREWGRDADTGMVLLQPGQTTQWRIRLEIFSLFSTKLQ